MITAIDCGSPHDPSKKFNDLQINLEFSTVYPPAGSIRSIDAALADCFRVFD
jgi:hypothetical protein